MNKSGRVEMMDESKLFGFLTLIVTIDGFDRVSNHFLMFTSYFLRDSIN